MNLGSFGTVHTYYKADIICLEAPEKILGSKGQLISEKNTPKPQQNQFTVFCLGL